ncbi:MAG TPA: UDP-N-acetylmuramoyl-L-alanyl-D-glutamate--2,6-diaminopimelate ligase [Clostridiaceae bacterium]|nr:UDP-N-acetylmuramoyl-L-alanyl-D-glutamate--2,6-diaminopimelate ligase [Clostridiaceae bacterium]
MILKELVSGLEIESSKGDLNIEIHDIAYDSRKAKNGSLFVCIEGFTTDGHKYIPSAINNGTKALLVQKDVEVPEDVTVVKIKDTRYGLAHVSHLFFGKPSEKFSLIGVTGTKGKTSTTFMIKAILEAAGQKTGLIGTIHNMIGDEVLYGERTTPESHDLQSLFAQMRDKGVSSVVMEVSSHGLELHRVSCSQYDIGVFTNLYFDHIGENELHHSMEDYYKAKAKLFSMCRKGLVNIDSSYGKRLVDDAGCEVYTYGIESNADFRATDIKSGTESVEFTVKTPWSSDFIKVGIPGKFNVYNALAAIGACCLLNVPMNAIKRGLADIKVPGRLEVVETGRDFTVIVDYAHNAASLENLLTTVREFTPGRLVCVFGCGGNRAGRRIPMGEISGRMADFTVITSDNPRTEDPEDIIKEIEEGIRRTNGEYIKIIDRYEGIRYALDNARSGDVIVIAGKGHETYQQFKDKTIHFDDREVVREILKR